MWDDHDINQESERVGAGALALILLACIGYRLWNWWAGMSVYKTFLGAVAGRPSGFSRLRCWDYGLWELYPDGQLAGIAMIIVVLSVIGVTASGKHLFYWVGGSVIVGGYFVNAYFFLKLMAAY